MNYQINRNGQTIGTYDSEALRAAVLSGEVLGTDLAWTQGMPEWKSVSIVLAGAPLLASQAVSLSAERIRAVATNHREMNYCLLLSIVTYVALIILSSDTKDALGVIGAGVCLAFGFVFAIALFVFWCMKVYKLADALEAGPAILWTLGMFVPCLSYLLVLILSQKAGNFLKANGVKVGFLGADSSTLP